jgi:CRP-like cAMP-binding protein
MTRGGARAAYFRINRHASEAFRLRLRIFKVLIGGPTLCGKGLPLLDPSLTDSELEMVRNTALFGGLNDNLMSSLMHEAFVQRGASGETLFMQGDPVTACFILLDGWVKLYRLAEDGGEAVVSVFSRGQSFAEAAVFSMATYPVTAEAVTASKLLRISRDTLRQKVRENPEFALAMLTSTSAHLKQLVRQIEQLKTHTGTQRVARFLASLCPVDEGSCTIGLPYDKALIAGRLGMKPESLSRAFARLRTIGVRVERNAAAITNIEHLRQYASDGRSSDKISYR